MAKKNKGKAVQMLSSENYIRKKARTLPILECWINKDWEESGVANIIITRSHTNGNITACYYYVDLYCLGIKDSYHQFNIPQFELQERLDYLNEGMEMINVDYTLAHNIVYAGLEFAEDYGFKPHKDFTTTTQFMLEEDTDDIELMEIECGKNGKPLYVQGPMDNQAKAHKVIAQLEKTAGTGNFHYILEGGSRPFGDDFDDDYVNEFDNYSLKKKHEILAELLARADNLSAEEKERMSDVTLSIYNSLIEIDKVNDYFHILMEQFDDYYFNDELSEEFLGSTFNSNEEKNKFLSLFIDLYESFDEDNKAAKKKLKALYKKYKNIPVLGFIELMMLNKKDSSVYETKLKQYHQEFPYYPLLNLLWARHQLSGKADDAMSTSGNPGINDYFPGRELLNYVEIFHYIIFLIDSQLLERTPSKLEAIEMAIEELELPEPQLKMLDEVIKLAKFTFIIASKQNL